MAHSAANWNTYFEHSTLTDVGLRRSNNQDSLAVVLAGDEQDWFRRGHIFMVADGMGAHAAGELASKLACNGVPHTYKKLLGRFAPETLRQAVVEINTQIHDRGQANAEFQGMGTTASVLALLPQGAVIAHVGDSRVYRLRRSTLEQLTFDHSLVWEMMAAGQMPAGNVPSYVPKNIITRSLGPHAQVQVDIEGPFALEPGDTFLLCSDGLSGQVKDEEIGAILDSMSTAEAARVLIDMANLRGGPDNITVLVVRIKEAPWTALDADSVPLPGAEKPPVHPALWVAMGVCALAAVSMALSGYVIAAILSGLGALVAAGVGLFGRSGQDRESGAGGFTGPLGAGPHTTRSCEPSAESTAGFAEVAGKLKDAATGENWSVDWSRLNGHLREAQLATEKSDFAAAVRQYGLAISFMMNEIRHQRGRNKLDKADGPPTKS
jgi:protein phosphatase